MIYTIDLYPVKRTLIKKALMRGFSCFMELIDGLWIIKGKNIYNEYQIRELEKNPNVLRASERTISNNPEFKINAVKEYKNGKTPSQIFIEHGFNLENEWKETAETLSSALERNI